MTSQLRQIGLGASRLPAVWWADLSGDKQRWYFSSALNQRQYFKPLGNGEKGCYASHVLAWQQLLASDAPALVVLEDDVRLLPALPQVLQAIAQLPAQSWDMVKLYGREHEKIAQQMPLADTGVQLIT